MPSVRPALAACLFVAVSLGGASFGAASEPAPPSAPTAADAPLTADASLIERSRVRLRTVRLRFEPARDARPGECRELTLDDLQVRLRGEPLERDHLIDLERRRQPTLHALLIDTSASMVGKIDHARRAARDYVEALDPTRDRALVATFDESVILVQPLTADRERLAAAIDGIRMGAMTSMLDGLYYGIGALLPHRERPVVVLLTDGVDSASLEEHRDVRALADSRGDLIVFTVGYQLPPIDRAPSGTIATRKFLGRLAESTDGEFFDVPSGGRLDDVFRRIRETLEMEALLTFADPDPAAPPGKIKVRLPTGHCRLHVYRTVDDAPVEQERPIPDASRIGLSAGPRERFLADRKIHHRAEAPCRNEDAASLDDLWYAERGPAGIRGCALDVMMEPGILYSAIDRQRIQHNGWIMMRTRPFELRVPPVADLPGSPAEALDVLARQASAVAGDAIETDARMRPAERHARPWGDMPAIVNGRTLLASRDAFARALYGYPAYRAWAHERLTADVEAELVALRARFRLAAPGASPDAIEQAVALSDEGRRIARRAVAPTAADLERRLGAWLGDIPAHQLFVEWEVLRANRLLADGDVGRFAADWAALRRLFFVPSYARVLGLLTPFRDEAGDRIGFWRVVLPRPGWLQPRLKNAVHHPEWSDLPLDLIPDRPMGFEILETAFSRDPALRARLGDDGYVVTDVRYRLLGKPYRHDPRRAFRDTRVEVVLVSPGNAETLHIGAHALLDKDGTLTVEALELAEVR